MIDFRELVRAVNRLHTRVMNSIARAVVQRVADGRKMQILQIGVMAGEDIDDAERVQNYGFSSVPLEGAEGVVVFPGGDRAHALVVAVDDRRYRPTGGEPGEVVVYNAGGASIRLKADGSIELRAAAGQDISLGDGGSTSPLALAADLEELRAEIASAATGDAIPSAIGVLGPYGGTSRVKGE